VENHASTKQTTLYASSSTALLQARLQSMAGANMATFDDLNERVERLLVRFDELQRTNQLLTERLKSAESERDSLKSRLTEARSRVDSLLAKLPDNIPLAHTNSQEQAYGSQAT
jgi:predicted nuclease with TOPRIM domain